MFPLGGPAFGCSERPGRYHPAARRKRDVIAEGAASEREPADKAAVLLDRPDIDTDDVRSLETGSLLVTSCLTSLRRTADAAAPSGGVRPGGV